jgi:hypothetical protein
MARIMDQAAHGAAMTIRYRKRIACQGMRHHFRAGALGCDCGFFPMPWPYTLLPITDEAR